MWEVGLYYALSFRANQRRAVWRCGRGLAQVTRRFSVGKALPIGAVAPFN